MKIIIFSVALIALLCVGGAFADRDDDDDNGRNGNGRPRAPWNAATQKWDPDFERRHKAHIDSLGGAPIPSPPKVWEHNVHWVPEFFGVPGVADGTWVDVFNIKVYQYNDFDTATGEFRFGQYYPVTLASGNPGCQYMEFRVRPFSPAVRFSRNGRPVESTVSEYRAYNSTYTNAATFYVTKSEHASVNVNNKSNVGSYIVDGRVAGSEIFDIIVPNQHRYYSLMIYDNSAPAPAVRCVWVAFNTHAIEFPSWLSAAMAARAAGQFTYQNDVTVANSGIDAPMLSWEFPPTRDISVNATDFAINTRNLAAMNKHIYERTAHLLTK